LADALSPFPLFGIIFLTLALRVVFLIEWNSSFSPSAGPLGSLPLHFYCPAFLSIPCFFYSFAPDTYTFHSLPAPEPLTALRNRTLFAPHASRPTLPVFFFFFFTETAGVLPGSHDVLRHIVPQPLFSSRRCSYGGAVAVSLFYVEWLFCSSILTVLCMPTIPKDSRLLTHLPGFSMIWICLAFATEISVYLFFCLCNPPKC